MYICIYQIYVFVYKCILIYVYTYMCTHVSIIVYIHTCSGVQAVARCASSGGGFGPQVGCLQHTATHCNTLQHTAIHFNTLQYTATHCNTLQHTATHCNTLHHTATKCKTMCASHHQPRLESLYCECSGAQEPYSVLQCVAVCCCVLLCVAVCRSVL